MIVIDSSVWINHIRRIETHAVAFLKRNLKPGTILVGDLVLVEVLQGCRTDSEADRTERLLKEFEFEEMLGLEIARQAANNYRRLRQRGITARSAVDVMIATFCIEHRHELLTEDRDFTPMAQHLGLRLVLEPRS